MLGWARSSPLLAAANPLLNLIPQLRAMPVHADPAALREYLIAQVQQFEARKAQLQQRVTLIEQLRRGQAGPVHALDEISRALPDRLWLTDLSEKGTTFTMTGMTTSLTGLSDFVANLEASTWFTKPVDIIDSQVQPGNAKSGDEDMFKFSVKATFNNPDAPPLPATPAGKKK